MRVRVRVSVRSPNPHPNPHSHPNPHPNQVWPYYGVAAMLMILCFSVGVPVVFYELVKG